MIPQGSTSFNTTYFTNLTAGINAAGSCAQLQSLVTEAFGSLGALKSAVNTELAAVEGVAALLTAPSANPTAIVTWITSFITAYLTPMIVPATTYAAQLTAIASQITALTTAITTAQAKFPSCSISIPSI